MSTWAADTQLGPYVLVSQIGAGGMGEVWKARDTRLDRMVAVKRLKAEYTDRFEQEARAIASLNHPHICQLYDIGPDYLVMEYIEGQPLQCPLPAYKAVRLAIQIASALEAAHRRGIIHRDLKPANVMVTADGTAKLLDFGLAKPITSADSDVTGNTMTGALMGTASYLSPEQAEGKPLDARSDIFSFGAVLYEMVSGSRAFDGSSAAQVVSAVLRDEPRPLQSGPALQRIIARCLAKQPGQRFQTVMEIRVDLEQVNPLPSALEPSIAVLPFANMSADKENEYFSDGLTEEIINALAHVPGLKVTARTSAFAFRGKELDIRKIAQALDVRTILEGSVRRAGNRIRVTAQLINAVDGYHLWSERFDREIADVFAIQDEIAQAISGALQVKLSGKSMAVRRYTPKLPAYEAYLKALYYMQKPTPHSMARAEECFEEAILLDPEFALAHSAFGNHFALLAIYGLLPAHEAMPRARIEARKALDIEPSLPEANALLGLVAALYDYDWSEAERHFKLAMASESVSAQVRHYYGFHYLFTIGRYEEAVEQQKRARKEDPLNLRDRASLAPALRAVGRGGEALIELHSILQLDENFWLTYFLMGIIHASQGNIADAAAYAEKAYSLAPWMTVNIGLLAAVLKRTGDVDRSAELLQKLLPGDTYGAPLGLAHFYLYCEDVDQAIYWAEKAIEQRQPAVLFFLNTHAQLLRSSPRWLNLARLLNLPQSWGF
jgi:serine/threonine-protein kinase